MYKRMPDLDTRGRGRLECSGLLIRDRKVNESSILSGPTLAFNYGTDQDWRQG